MRPLRGFFLHEEIYTFWAAYKGIAAGDFVSGFPFAPFPFTVIGMLQAMRAEVIGDQIAFVWNDDRESFIPLEKLRRACPCAACGGEPDILGNIQRPRVSYGPPSFQLRTFRFIGGYAFQPVWNDGHDTGLYTFPQLRALDDSAA